MAVSLASIAALAACSGMRAAEQPAAAPSPAPAAAATSPEAPAAAARPDAAESAPAVPADGNSPPSCTCAQAEVKPKPKPKARPKSVRKEAPPQLPTAPVVATTPAGGVVDAQVRATSESVMSILGKRVQGPQGEDVGRVVDVLADSSGRVRVAIIDFGGFLGVGDRRIAVDWPLLRFDPRARDASILLAVSPEKLKSAPEYKDNARPQTLMEPPAPPSTPPTAEGKK